MNYKKEFNLYQHYFIYFLCALSYSFFIDISMPDDGLRHIAFASNKDIMQSWGNVYPHSLFTTYDPWFAWHGLLGFLLNFVSFESIHIVINTFSLFVLMLLVHEVIERYSKYDFSSLLYIIVFIIIMLTSYRYVMVRPDLLSGLYIISALLLSNRFITIFILTIFYIPFYYLFFLYTGSIGLVYLIQKKFRAFFGVFLGSIVGLLFHFIYDFEGYVNTVINILTDQSLRMGLAVTEGEPIIDLLSGLNYYILIPIFLLLPIFFIYKKYSYFKNNPVAIFLLVSSLLWVNQTRYYHLFLPLIFSFALVLFVNLDKKRLLYKIRVYYVIAKKYFNYSKNKKLFYLIAIPYSILMLSYIFSSQSFNEKIEPSKYYENEKFDNKTILYSKMLTEMFQAHYFNGKIKMVPSCSIGWFEEKKGKIKNIYVRLQSMSGDVTEEELRELIDYIDADYFIYFFKDKKQKFDIKKLISLGIIPEEIVNNKLVFKIKKINEK